MCALLITIVYLQLLTYISHSFFSGKIYLACSMWHVNWGSFVVYWIIVKYLSYWCKKGKIVCPRTVNIQCQYFNLLLLLIWFFPATSIQVETEERWLGALVPYTSVSLKCLPSPSLPSDQTSSRRKQDYCMRWWLVDKLTLTSEGYSGKRAWMAFDEHHGEKRVGILEIIPQICRWYSLWTYSTQQPADSCTTEWLATGQHHHSHGIFPPPSIGSHWCSVLLLSRDYIFSDQLLFLSRTARLLCRASPMQSRMLIGR